jgi:DNA-binding NtrC family response regulator
MTTRHINSPGKVLIVDDEPLILRSLARAIKRHNVEVHAVDRAADALSEIRTSSFDLIFLDIVLPDGNGIDIMTEVKMVSPETKVVVMSASLLSEESENIIEEHALCFMSKPFTLLQVKSILGEALELEERKVEVEEALIDIGSKERIHRRTRCEGSVSVKILTHGEKGAPFEELTVDVVNMSEGGAGLYSSSPLSPETTLLFEGVLEGKKGFVKWCEKSGDGFRIGIEFS